VMSGPLSDNVRFRIGGNYSSQTGGFFHNFDGPSEGGVLPQGNGGESYYAEAQLEANIGDHLDAWGMVSTGDYDTNFHTVATVGNYPDYEFPNAALTPSAFYGLCGLPGHSGDPGCAGNPDTIVPGSVVTDKVVASSFPGNNPSNVNLHNFIETSRQSNDQSDDVALATHWTYHFPTMDLEYIGGYQTFNYQLKFGPGIDAGVTQYQLEGATPATVGTCAFVFGAGAIPACESPLTVNPAGNTTDFDEFESYFSHELNLSSTDSGPLQWIAGLYWYHEHFNQPVGLGCNLQQTQMVNPMVTIAGPTGYVAPSNPDGCAVNLDGNLQYDSVAGYGQVTYKFNDQFNFEAAARYTEDHKYGFEQVRVVEFGDSLGGLLPFTPSNFGAATPGVDITAVSIATGKYPGAGLPVFDAATGYFTRALNGSWGAWTGDATLNWTPDSETLAYAKYSRGYKTGGFSAGQVAANPETLPEYVDAFEIGVKKTVGSALTLNAAAFYYNYYNDQQPINVALPGLSTTTSEIFNIPAVRTYGFEFEGVWHPIDPLAITAEYSYLSSKVTSANGACFENTSDPLAILPGANTKGCPVAAAGQPQLQNIVGYTLPEAPANKLAFNALYTFTFDPGKLILSASYIWKDKTYGELFNNPQTLAPAYSTVNIRAEWDDAKGRFNASLFVDNVFNTTGYDNVTETQLAPAGMPYDIISGKGLTFPLTVGGEIQVRFR
jgi:iron complex outermembrane receptor protein